MAPTSSPIPVGTHFGQVAWVVPDIVAAERFFRETLGVPGFAKLENLRAQDTDGTYNGKAGDFVFHLYMAYSNGILLELIQPVSGRSIYDEFLARNPGGGVQHVAFMVPDTQFDGLVQQFGSRGYPVVQGMVLPVAKVAYFDTRRDIGVATELIGATEAGMGWVEQLKNGVY